MISRRGLLGGVAAVLAAPRAGEAQPAEKVHGIGILAVNPWSAIDGLRRGLEELGYQEGRNLRYEYRWAEGRDERLPALAAELVRLKIDAIVTWGTPAALAARDATSTIPIVLGAIGDPVIVGLVSNLARPGGNITGFTTLSAALEAKRLELLKELVPTITRIVALGNFANPGVLPALPYIRSAAAALAVKVEIAEAPDAGGLERALTAVARQRPDALLVMADPFLITQRNRIAAFAVANRLPSVANYREYPIEAGGLMSYGPRYADLFRRAAGYVDRIFRGARPGDLPVQQPTTVELVVNAKTARALGLAIPPAVLLRADRVVE